ncbi:MAG: DUF4347 domain-containing protein, partial [Phycisphaerae bacterium]
TPVFETLFRELTELSDDQPTPEVRSSSSEFINDESDTSVIQNSFLELTVELTTARKEIVFIDASVPDHEMLVRDILNSGAPETEFQTILLRGNDSGVRQISEALALAGEVSAVHIISHGASGEILLGHDQLSLNNLPDYVQQIGLWSAS